MELVTYPHQPDRKSLAAQELNRIPKQKEVQIEINRRNNEHNYRTRSKGRTPIS